MTSPESPAASRLCAAIALLLIVPVPSLAVFAALYQFPGAVGQAIFTAAKFWLLALPVAWNYFVDREKPSLSKPQHGGFVPALILGVAIVACIVGAYFIAYGTWITPADVESMKANIKRMGLDYPALYIAAAVYWCVLNSLIEEYVWRWFVYRKCETLLPQLNAWPAVILSSLFFTAHHVLALAAQVNWKITLLGSLGVFIGGVAWSWLYRRYRSVWPCYVCHAMADVPIFVIGYVLMFK